MILQAKEAVSLGPTRQRQRFLDTWKKKKMDVGVVAAKNGSEDRLNPGEKKKRATVRPCKDECPRRSGTRRGKKGGESGFEKKKVGVEREKRRGEIPFQLSRRKEGSLLRASGCKKTQPATTSRIKGGEERGKEEMNIRNPPKKEKRSSTSVPRRKKIEKGNFVNDTKQTTPRIPRST